MKNKTEETRKADHPSLVRARAKFCGRGGCTAKTQTGIVRYAIAHREGPTVFDLGSDSLHPIYLTVERVPDRTHFCRYSERKIRPELPQSERDARRAKNDPKFRRRWVADIRRQAEKLALVPMGTLAEVTIASDSRTDRVRQLSDLQKLAASAGQKLNYAIPKIPVGVLIECDIALARRVGCKIDMTGKNASFQSTRGASKLFSAPGETEWKNGCPVKYTRATRDNYVRSFAVIRDARTLDYALHTREMRVELPVELAWDVDKNGLRAYRIDSIRDDYHPEASDLLAGVARIVAKLEENRTKRLTEEARLTAEKADAEGVYICLADSLRAGNCQAASEAWMLRHGLEKNRHYPAVAILGIIGQDDPGRARLAISAAVHRHHREMERGYAELAEHVA